MSETAAELRCMLIPLRRGRLLLPNSAVAEVIGYREPEAVAGAPAWVQGKVGWRQRELMVIDFERLLGHQAATASVRQRIAICYALDPNAPWPLLGLLSQGIPRLLRVHGDVIDAAATPSRNGSPVRMRITVDGDELMVPDLDYLQSHLPPP